MLNCNYRAVLDKLVEKCESLCLDVCFLNTPLGLVVSSSVIYTADFSLLIGRKVFGQLQGAGLY